MKLQRDIGLKSSKEEGSSYFRMRSIKVELKGACMSPLNIYYSTTRNMLSQ
jgi:hypothetical protein